MSEVGNFAMLDSSLLLVWIGNVLQFGHMIQDGDIILGVVKDLIRWNKYSTDQRFVDAMSTVGSTLSKFV